MRLKEEQSKSNFIQNCLSGEAFLDEIDDYVEEWHKGGTGMRLYEFLGMTQDDYSLWAKDPDSLSLIIAAHKQNKPVAKVIELYADSGFSMAARSIGIDKAMALKTWLQKQGEWQ